MRGSTGLAIVGVVLAVVCGIEIVAHGPLNEIDWTVALSYLPLRHTATTDLGDVMEDIGKPWIACTVVGLLGLVVSLATRRIGPLAAAILGLGVVGSSTLILKATFPHPSIAGHLPGSFPSGHTGVAVVSAGLVIRLLFLRRAWAARAALVGAAGWGALMGWSRLVIDAHWLSDVLAGWGIGMAALVLALRTVDSPLGTREWARPAPADR